MSLTRALALAIMINLIPALACSCELNVDDPWIRAAPPTAKVMAAYMTFENRGSNPCAVSRISSPLFGAIEIHRTIIKDGVARMVMQPGLEIPAGGRVEAEPGGLHLMLMQPRRLAQPGERVPVDLHLDDGTVHSLFVPVRRPHP